MSGLEQFKEDMAFKLYGRSRTLALAGNECVKCGEFNLEFRDEISRKEYGITALCQPCQDSIFKVDDEDDEDDEPTGPWAIQDDYI